MPAKTKRKNHFPKLPWLAVAEDLKKRAKWNLVESNPTRKIFERGRNEKLIAVKVGPRMWKAEYFQSGRLMDASGFWDEEMLKRMIYEMGIFHAY
jgi:hypothetical protein